MTRKRRRLYLVLSGLAAAGLAAGIALYALSKQIMFYVTPSELIARHDPAEQVFRLGGLVEKGSVVKSPDGLTSVFTVTDGKIGVRVRYAGLLPDLFREGQGVVAEGRSAPDGSFNAARVLAKHDERYMPKEVADKLKAEGHWQGGDAKSGS